MWHYKRESILRLRTVSEKAGEDIRGGGSLI